MKNKGFTLVELLAVIAILAILVIVAMPNVLGMFNQAKVNSFVTEVQKIMETAATTFTKDALVNSGKTVYYSSADNAVLGTKSLDMSGNKKNYFIEMNRNGEFKRVVVYDSNYCYDIRSSDSNGKYNNSKSKLVVDKISKTTVDVSDVWEAGNDSVGITINGTNYVVSGCEGVVTIEGKDNNVQLDTVKIAGIQYSFVPGMTWEEWLDSEYNVMLDVPYSNDTLVFNSAGSLRYNEIFCTFKFGIASSHDYVNSYDMIVKNVDYTFVGHGELPRDHGDCRVGVSYYDDRDPIEYNMQQKIYTK